MGEEVQDKDDSSRTALGAVDVLDS
jgi:hypothetical protein